MKEDRCLFAGGARVHRRGLLPGSHRLLREVLTCGGALLALYGVAPVHALSGFPDTGQIGFFSDPDEPDKAKFYCDWRFDPAISPLIPACAQHDAGLVAVQVVSDGFDLGAESGVTISSTAFGVITTSTKNTARVALICETAGDGTELNHCLQITENPEDGEGVSSCPEKFASITSDLTRCAADLAKLQEVFGDTAHIDFTKDRNEDGSLNVNVCTQANWICEDRPSSLTGLGNRKIQQIPAAVVDTPITCKIGGRNVNYPDPLPTPPKTVCP